MFFSKKTDSDAEDQKRLKILSDAWHEQTGYATYSKEIKPSDLRLLLENFAPLQNLIRSLVAEAAGGHAQPLAAPHFSASHAQATDNSDLAEQLDAALLAQEQAENEIRDLKKDLHDCNNAVASLIKARDEQTSARETAQSEYQHAQQQWAKDRQKLERELWQCKDELGECQAQLQQAGSAPAELAFLRQDSALAKALGLMDLPENDTQALIRMVAVLSSRDSVTRLLETLKDRCEAQNRAINPDERALLVAAVEWLNHNWPNRPYALIDVPAHSSYKFDTQQRFKHAPTGDHISETILLGLADGAGKVICKPLVRTS